VDVVSTAKLATELNQWKPCSRVAQGPTLLYYITFLLQPWRSWCNVSSSFWV